MKLVYAVPIALLSAAAVFPVWTHLTHSEIAKAKATIGRTLSFADEANAAPGQLTIIDQKGKEQGLCPLKHTDAQVDIAGYVARVTVNQEFENPSQEAIEAIYTFPLPADSAVDDMTMKIGSRVIRGEIKRREEAREIYEAARDAGKTAALLDQERPNIFTQSVANIMPGERVVIQISYVQLLKYEEGEYEFSFPMVVGPRYTAQGGYTVPGQRGNPSPPRDEQPAPGTQAIVRDADKITPPITPKGTRAGHNISMTVRIDAGLPIQHVKSQLHKVNIQNAGATRRVITLKNQQEIPNKDFILRYSAAGAQMQSGMLTYADGKGGGYFTLILQPPASPARTMIAPKEMVFVIDQTGSQMGEPMKKSKETMAYCIKNLNPNDTFQVLAFNTEVFPCFPKSVPMNAANIQKALKFIEPLEGNGGTDILKSVDYALKMPGDPKRLRIICYMTDGYVGNDMQILDHVGKHRGDARMFLFGIGNSVNRFLIDRMAREGRGASEIVDLEADGKKVAEKFYRRAADPVLLDPKIDWGSLPVEEIYPQHVPDVFSAGPIIVKGRYTRPGNGAITVRGILRGEPWQVKIPVNFPARDQDGSAIATLWAREKIEHLQSQDWLGAQTGQPQEDLKERIIQVALEHRLMSQFTSFVAVEEKVVNVNGQPRKVDVPVEMPDGVAYEGIFGDDVRRENLALGRKLNMAPASRPSGNFGGGGVVGQPSRTRGQAHLEVKDEGEAANYYFGIDPKAVADGNAEAWKQLQKLSPQEQRDALVSAKLSPALQLKVKEARSDPAKASVKVEVNLTLNSLTSEQKQQLESLGFKIFTELKPGRLLLGEVETGKIEELLNLAFIRRLDLAKLK